MVVYRDRVQIHAEPAVQVTDDLHGSDRVQPHLAEAQIRLDLVRLQVEVCAERFPDDLLDLVPVRSVTIPRRGDGPGSRCGLVGGCGNRLGDGYRSELGDAARARTQAR